MKNNHLTRHIKILAEGDDVHTLEKFIDQICDDYHIYDAYYGNIMTTIATLGELIGTIKKEKGLYIDVYFNSSPAGLSFTIKLGRLFLDIAKDIEKAKKTDLNDPEAYIPSIQQVKTMEMLSDEIRLDPEEESIVIRFNISGINDMLSLQRVQMLDNYFQKVVNIKEL